ncbi:MAG: Gfo/Idh/MocA family oxidoreductase [Lachnospiraceae bacterium]|nr:Gfo/Idh/MocA family oxidoreductase [Lachnospiraceae bacterium]
MKKITFAILGMGNRGTAYAAKQLKYPDEMEVTAMADIRRIRLDAANKYLHLPAEKMFDSAEALLEMPKLADIMVIATQDAQHRDHAMRAMERGYDLLLEKPMSNKLDDCVELVKAAKRMNRKVFICHVLRYTVFYQQIKRLIAEGAIGKVESIEAAELVGAHHYAHSYVRGNWHNEAASSPMILAKSSHDMDIIAWLAGKSCEKVTSFGSLDYFRAENCPNGAAERCAQCSVDCPFNADKYYMSRIPGWPANILHPEPTPENITEVLKTSDYGRCVYKMDNDVVDHQVVNMLLQDGVTATFQMTGFSNRQTRTIRVMGTRGEIWGDFKAKELYWQRFCEEPQKVDLDCLCDDFTGHGGGDARLVYDVIRFMRGDKFDTTSMTTIDRSADSHILAFAAEKSRVLGGELIELEKFKKECGI